MALVPLEGITRRDNKQSGFLEGMKVIMEDFRIYLEILEGDKLRAANEAFSKSYFPRLKEITGMNFSTIKTWFNWWRENKDRLTLSKNGEQLLVDAPEN